MIFKDKTLTIGKLIEKIKLAGFVMGIHEERVQCLSPPQVVQD